MKTSARTMMLTGLLVTACGHAGNEGALAPAQQTKIPAAVSGTTSVASGGTVAVAPVMPVAATGSAGQAGTPLTAAANAGTTAVSATAGAGGVMIAGASAIAGSGGIAAGAGGAAAPDLPGTVTMKTDTFVLKAGEEVYKCQNFDNPFGNKTTAIQAVSTDMSPGSHHLHVYHMTTSDTRTLEDCDISDFHPLLFASGSPHLSTVYPPGMAAKLLGTAGLRIQVHYLNTTDKDLTVQAVLKLSPGDASTVTKWVSELYFNQLKVSVPPGAGTTITTTCAIPKTYGPIGLIGGGTHMHSRGVHFVAKTSTGAMLADVDTWDEPPPIAYDPPIMLNPGDTITWSCTYDNTTTKTLTFGESVADNEMCIYLARFFSDPDGTQLECQAQGPMGTTTERTY